MRTYIQLSKTQIIGLDMVSKTQRDFVSLCLTENLTEEERTVQGSWIFDGKGFQFEEPKILQASG